MFFYVLFYVIGIIGAFLSPLDAVKEGLAVIEPITLTALFASLLVAFAGFAQTEKWHKFVLQYGLIPLFGVYTVVLWEKSSVTGLLLLVGASGVHVAYWMSSIHSREYRLRQFQLGFAPRMPATARLIAMLNGQSYSHEADEVISSLLNGKSLAEARLRTIFSKLETHDLVKRALGEIANC